MYTTSSAKFYFILQGLSNASIPPNINIKLASALVIITFVHVCHAEADRAAAQAGLGAFRSVLTMTGSTQPMAGQFAAAASMQVNMLAAPQALQDKKLHLGKKVIVRGRRSVTCSSA